MAAEVSKGPYRVEQRKGPTGMLHEQWAVVGPDGVVVSPWGACWEDSPVSAESAAHRLNTAYAAGLAGVDAAVKAERSACEGEGWKIAEDTNFATSWRTAAAAVARNIRARTGGTNAE